MVWSNFGAFYSNIALILVFILFIFFLSASWKDYRERKIPNIIILGIFLLGIIWNILLAESGIKIIGENHIIEFIFITVVGYLLYLKDKIGAGDIKLTISLSVFFLISGSPIIFVGNIAALSLMLLGIYIFINILFVDSRGIKGLYYRANHKMKLFYKRIIHGIYFGKKERDVLKKFYWFFSIISIYLFQLIIEQVIVPRFSFLIILVTPIGKISVFIILIYLFQYLFSRNTIIVKIQLLLIVLILGWGYQNNAIVYMFSSITYNLIFLLKIFIAGYFVLLFYNTFRVVLPKKKMPLNKIQVGDVIDTYATKDYWEGLSNKNEDESHRLLAIILKINVISMAKEDAYKRVDEGMLSEFHRLENSGKNIYSGVCIQKTLPYGIYIILGFILSFLTDINLSKILLEKILGI